MPTSSRMLLPYPALSDPADVPLYMQNLVTALDTKGGMITSGLLSARPTPGATEVDRMYFATDNGLLYRWSGSAWSTVNPAALTDQAAGVGSMRTLGTGSTQAMAGNDSRVTGAAQVTSGTFASRPSAGTANRFYRTTDTGMVYMDTGSTWIAIGGATTIDVNSGVLAYNAAWPASPVDGQIVHRFASATNNVPIWTFRYVAANAAGLKWVFIGGAPLWINSYNLPPTYTVQASPVNLTSYLVGGSSPHWLPGVTGTYWVEPQLFLSYTPTAGNNYQNHIQLIASAVASVSNNGVQPEPANMLQHGYYYEQGGIGDWEQKSVTGGTSYNFYFGVNSGAMPASIGFFVSGRVMPIYCT